MVVVELIVLVATAVPAWRTGRQSTTAALASVTAHPARWRWLGRITGRLGLGPVGLAGLRDALGRPARSVLTTVALALAVVAALVTIGTNRSIDRVFGDPTLVGNPEEIRVYPVDAAAASEIPEVLEGSPGVGSWFTETPTDLALGDETFLGIALGGNVADAGFAVREGRMFERSGEAVAGWGLLNRFDLDVGDRISVDAAGSPIELTIVGWYRESEDTGEILRFPLEDLEAIGAGRDPAWASVNAATDVDPGELASSLSEELGGAARLEVVDTSGSDEIDAFRVAFLLVSALVIIVAFANLLSTMLLAARERAHDFGVLRAVGVTPRQIRAVVAAGAATLAIAAGVVGVPLAWLVTSAVTEVVGAASGIGPSIGVGPGLIGTLLVVPLVVGIAAALGAAASRRATRAAVSELVRYE
jgi:putative ABC transport system permease protein